MIKANNTVNLLGRLGGDPETKVFDNGNSVCNFSLATSDQWKDKDGNKQERTQWHRITAYGKTGEILAQYLSKGSQVQILGSLTYRKWEDKHGQSRQSCEVVAESFSFVGDGNKNETRASDPVTSNGQAQQAQTASSTSEPLPF